MEKIKIFRDLLILTLVIALVFSSASITADTSDPPELQLSSPNSSQQYDQIISMSSSGDVIWDNGMNYYTLHRAEWYDDPAFDSFEADDFSFDADTGVADVHWIGGYWNTGHETGDFEWCIQFFEDDDDEPDGIPYDTSFAGPYCYDWEDIAKLEIENDGYVIYYEMSIVLPEILTFSAGEKYWISIWGVGMSLPYSGWGAHQHPQILLSPAVWGSDSFVYSYWTPGSDVVGYAHDMCFQLTAPPTVKDFRYTNVEWSRCLISEDFEGRWPSTGWQVIDYGSLTPGWIQYTYGDHSYECGGTGSYYVGCWYAQGTGFDSGLFTPSFDPNGEIVRLEFERNFQDFAGYGYFEVNTYSGGIGPGNYEENILFITVDDPTAGIHTELFFDTQYYTDPNDVYIEFYYNDDNYQGWGVSIDDVEICLPAQLGDLLPTTTVLGSTYSLVLDEDFESDDGGFTATGAWEWGVPTSGPTSAHSGTQLWATTLNDNYPNSNDAKLESAPITLLSGTSWLEFWMWYDCETNYDGMNVKISTDAGITWSILGSYLDPYNEADAGTTNYPNAGIDGEPCFSGHGQGYWEQISFDLSAYAGETVMIRFHFGSDSSVTYPGFYIDDVAIYTQDEYEYYDVKVVVDKKDKVKSTNPGQLYGVISIPGPVSEIDITDNFDYEFDVNPPKLGGGVEIIIVDPDGFATILTDGPGINVDVDNELNTVDISIDLIEATGDPLPDGWTLMVYIKFKTAMKHELWECDFDQYFINIAEIEIDEYPSFTTGAEIYLTEK